MMIFVKCWGKTCHFREVVFQLLNIKTLQISTFSKMKTAVFWMTQRNKEKGGLLVEALHYVLFYLGDRAKKKREGKGKG